MKIRDLNSNEYEHEVSMVDFENFFSIYEDKRSNYSYNLNENLYLNIDYSSCEIFTLTHDMFWPLISYKIYGTTKLAWLLCKINKIENPMLKIKAGLKVYYIPKDSLNTILQTIND